MSEIPGPSPEERGVKAEIVQHEIESEEPQTGEFVEILREGLKDRLDEDSLESVLEEFVSSSSIDDYDAACGYLRSVAIENDLEEYVEQLLTKSNLYK